jgi:hypothetical protein
MGRRSCRDAVFGIDADTESGAQAARVSFHHRSNPKLVESPRQNRHANKARSMPRHEADVLWSYQLSGDYEVPLVLTLLIVHDDYELAGFEVGNRLWNRRQRHRW